MDFTKFLLSLFTISGLIFPKISVAGIDVSQKNISEATEILSKNITPIEEVRVNYQDQEFVINKKDIDLTYDYLSSAQRAYQVVNTGNFFNDLKEKLIIYQNGKNLGLVAKYDNNKLNSFISVIAGQVASDPVYPTINLIKNKVVISQGVKGKVVDQNTLLSEIYQNISFNKNENINLPIKEVDPSLSADQINSATDLAKKLIGKKLEIKFENQTFTKNDSELIGFINPSGGVNENKVQKLVNEIVNKSEREPSNPKFVFDESKVSEFEPATDGVKVDKEKLSKLIVDAITNQNLAFDLPVDRTPPEVTTDKVNNLGIKELIGRGTSTYFHSIPGRVHNVALAASRINGTLVAPEETFSFNDTLGDVSKFTGYQEAYVISNGKTILGDGGGVCQVSTTLFRAVLNAGLPVDARTAHAYRVGYYEQGSPPGIDATVYSPSPDFKFTNNTGKYVLIEVKNDPKNYSLVFELYGTKDGRVATTTKPVITDVVAPPPDVYQDDPTLPAGTIKQVDFRAWGSKITFNYSVKKDGIEIYKKTFVSNYKPWAAVYLRGVGAVN